MAAGAPRSFAVQQMMENIMSRPPCRKRARVEDDGLEQVREVISLDCPLTRSRIEVPVRGRSCEHWQPFELETHLAHSLRQGRWVCPVGDCPAAVDSTALELDRVVYNALKVAGPADRGVWYIDGGEWCFKLQTSAAPASRQVVDLTKPDGSAATLGDVSELQDAMDAFQRKMANLTGEQSKQLEEQRQLIGAQGAQLAEQRKELDAQRRQSALHGKQFDELSKLSERQAEQIREQRKMANLTGEQSKQLEEQRQLIGAQGAQLAEQRKELDAQRRQSALHGKQFDELSKLSERQAEQIREQRRVIDAQAALLRVYGITDRIPGQIRIDGCPDRRFCGTYNKLPDLVHGAPAWVMHGGILGTSACIRRQRQSDTSRWGIYDTLDLRTKREPVCNCLEQGLFPLTEWQQQGRPFATSTAVLPH
eukprot:TRINITY_DN396_c0_g1_i2.p1 TRINITY_DN396_c0_g1~~TRINITY_DN396_c0_g1_i2.p1  ORF type:complete len:422 (+),score=143.65 TRINITY_DN396_c0_g1_i2:125-1390(+)